jgi:hypothetical protein
MPRRLTVNVSEALVQRRHQDVAGVAFDSWIARQRCNGASGKFGRL